jgi:hypothetical protein
VAIELGTARLVVACWPTMQAVEFGNDLARLVDGRRRCSAPRWRRTWHPRRTLRALAFITVWPRVTWPSPAITTWPLRRTETIVVAWNTVGFWLGSIGISCETTMWGRGPRASSMPSGTLAACPPWSASPSRSSTPPASCRRRLDSLLAQDYPHWECLLWDDGSTDGSGASPPPTPRATRAFRVLGDGRNRGVSASCAAALSQARGEYLAILDSDDMLEADALSSMLAFMHANPRLGMAYSEYVEVAEDGTTPGHRADAS